MKPVTETQNFTISIIYVAKRFPRAFMVPLVHLWALLHIKVGTESFSANLPSYASSPTDPVLHTVSDFSKKK